jgi:hypothetical protein
MEHRVWVPKFVELNLGKLEKKYRQNAKRLCCLLAKQNVNLG